MRALAPTPTTDEQVLALLHQHEPLCPSEIARRLDRAPRTVRYALRKLESQERVRWRHGLGDARCKLYRPDPQVCPPEDTASRNGDDVPEVATVQGPEEGAGCDATGEHT